MRRRVVVLCLVVAPFATVLTPAAPADASDGSWASSAFGNPVVWVLGLARSAP